MFHSEKNVMMDQLFSTWFRLEPFLILSSALAAVEGAQKKYYGLPKHRKGWLQEN